MANCSSVTLKGINTDCKNHIGGIKEVYLIKSDDIETVVADRQKGTITTITPKLEAKFQTYKFRKGTSNMESTATSDEAAGTFSVQTNLNLQFSKMEAGKRLEVLAMCLDSMVGIVLDQNGFYWYLGLDNPISATAATGATGTAFADFGGYNVTLTDDSREFPMPLSDEAVTALKEQINPAPVAGA